MFSRRSLEILGAVLIALLLLTAFIKTTHVKISTEPDRGPGQGFEQLQPPGVIVPVINLIGNHSVKPGEILEIRVHVLDPLGRDLEVYTSWLPPGASFDPVNLTLRWIPQPIEIGPFPITFIAYNGWNFAEETVVITVLPVTRPFDEETAEFQNVLGLLEQPPGAGIVPSHPAGSGRVITVENGGSIAAAIAGATDGDTIRVKGGTYHENLNIDRSITLIGEGNPVINGSGMGSPISVTIGGTTVEGFTLTGSGEHLYASGIKVSSNRNVIANNTIRENYEGIHFVHQSESNQVYRNLIFNNTGRGIAGDQLRNITVVANTIVNNGDTGISIGYTRNLLIGRNSVQYNRGDGVDLTEVTYTSLQDNTIGNNRGGGIRTSGGGRLVATGNTVDRNGGVGIFVDNSTDPLLTWKEIPLWRWSASEKLNTINGNLINRNDDSGIRVDLSMVMIRENTLRSNPQGILMNDAICEVRENLMEENSYGILMLNTRGTTVVNNTLRRNSNGIFLADQSENNRILENQIRESYASGIILYRDTQRNLVRENFASYNTDIGIADYGNNDLMDNVAIFNARNEVHF
jgi:parallel beta-helix repeat protein